MPTTDPITQASQAILTALKSSAAIAALIAAGNIVDMTSAQFANFRSQYQNSDYPLLVLLQKDFELKPFGVNSTVASISQSFALLVMHDTTRPPTANAIKFAVLAALLNAGSSLGLDGLVRDFVLTGGADDIEPTLGQKQKPAGRWSSVLTIKVWLDVSRQSLLQG